MWKTSFNYPHTCPKIDAEISKAQDCIQQAFEGLLEEACPFLRYEDVKAVAGDHAKNLYSDLESCFETVRSTNEDMRSAAEEQIEDLLDEIEDLRHNQSIDN